MRQNTGDLRANFTPVSAAIGGGLIGFSAALLMRLGGRIAFIAGSRERD
jgi:hypothetical protein